MSVVGGHRAEEGSRAVDVEVCGDYGVGGCGAGAMPSPEMGESNSLEPESAVGVWWAEETHLMHGVGLRFANGKG